MSVTVLKRVYRSMNVKIKPRFSNKNFLFHEVLSHGPQTTFSPNLDPYQTIGYVGDLKMWIHRVQFKAISSEDSIVSISITFLSSWNIKWNQRTVANAAVSWEKRVFLQINNAHSHTAKPTHDKLHEQGWKLLPNSSYSAVHDKLYFYLFRPL